MQAFVDLDIFPFIRISWLKWIDHVNRMDSKRAVRQVFNIKTEGSQFRGQPKRQMVDVCTSRCK